MEKNIQASETAGGASLAVDLPECSFWNQSVERLCIIKNGVKRLNRTLHIPPNGTSSLLCSGWVQTNSFDDNGLNECTESTVSKNCWYKMFDCLGLFKKRASLPEWYSGQARKNLFKASHFEWPDSHLQNGYMNSILTSQYRIRVRSSVWRKGIVVRQRNYTLWGCSFVYHCITFQLWCQAKLCDIWEY